MVQIDIRGNACSVFNEKFRHDSLAYTGSNGSLRCQFFVSQFTMLHYYLCEAGSWSNCCNTLHLLDWLFPRPLHNPNGASEITSPINLSAYTTKLQLQVRFNYLGRSGTIRLRSGRHQNSDFSWYQRPPVAEQEVKLVFLKFHLQKT